MVESDHRKQRVIHELNTCVPLAQRGDCLDSVDEFLGAEVG